MRVVCVQKKVQIETKELKPCIVYGIQILKFVHILGMKYVTRGKKMKEAIVQRLPRADFEVCNF